MKTSLALSTFGALLLTPLIVSVWSRLYPAAPLDQNESLDALKRRNNWIDIVATLFMFIGLFTPLALFGRNFNSIGLWAVGLMFGFMVSFHFLWVCIVTLPVGGIRRFREFWRFYEVKWGIAMKGIKVVYIPISLLGLVSLIKIWG